MIAKLSQNDLEVKPAILILFLLVGGFAGISLFMLEPEEIECNYYGYHDTGTHTGLCGDYYKRLDQMDNYNRSFFEDPRHYFTYTGINELGQHFVESEIRIMFFSFALGILFLVYFFTRNVTGLNYPGLIAVFLVMMSPIFHKYDTSITYPMHWVFLWLLSLFLITTKISYLSGFFWAISIPVKVFSALYFPVNFLFLSGSDMPKKRKILSLVVYGVLGGGLVFATFYVLAYNFYQFDVNLIDFAYWTGMWSIELQNDRVTLYFFYLCIPSLFLLHKARVSYAKSLLLALFAVMLIPAIVAGFTTFTNEEYRMLPMVILTLVSFCFVLCNIDKVIMEFQRFAPMFQFGK